MPSKRSVAVRVRILTFLSAPALAWIWLCTKLLGGEIEMNSQTLYQTDDGIWHELENKDGV